MDETLGASLVRCFAGSRLMTESSRVSHGPKEATMIARPHADVAIAVLISIAFTFALFAQEEIPEIYVVEGLQRVGLASLSHWENDWEYSRAIAAAAILAWFRGQGYAALLGDLNADATIDESDTVQLADRLAEVSMGCAEPSSETDAWLVIGLARYVGSKYPDGFEIEIYDPGFPEEYERVSGTAFSPNAIPGITITIGPEPTFDAYTSEMKAVAGVIVGLEQEVGRNLYFTGYSFLRDPLGSTTCGIGLLSPEEDWFAEGVQGKVVETSARQTDALLVEYRGEWVPAESLVALRSLLPRVSMSGSVICEDGTSACTATVEAVVERANDTPIETGFDIILDVSGDESRRAIVRTVMPEEINPTGRTTLAFTFPMTPEDGASEPCTYSLSMSFLGHAWSLDGLLPVIVAVPEAIHGDESCNGFYYGAGCCEDVPECLDLVVTTDGPSCSCEDVVEETWHSEPTHPRGGWWETEVVGITCEAKIRWTVENMGTKETGPFRVRIETSTGFAQSRNVYGLPPGHDVSRWFEIIVEECGPITVTIIADHLDEVDECDEENNTAHVTLDCD